MLSSILFSSIFPSDILLSPEEMTKQFRFQRQARSNQKHQGNRQTRVRVKSNSKVTVPKPFQMMLREAERKRHKVRTRSEIELENTLLRRELEELQECQKKFRASPAPAHIHLPLYEVISQRSGGRSSQSRRGSGGSSSGSSSSSSGSDTKRNQASDSAPPRPFHFLEREKRKREAKIVAELGKVGPKEERQAFKARPVPRSVYGNRQKAEVRSSNRQAQFVIISTQEREATEGQSDPNSDPELDVVSEAKSDSSADARRPQRCASSCKAVKKQIELSIEMVKEGEWSCNNYPPLQAGGAEALLSAKSDYISV